MLPIRFPEAHSGYRTFAPVICAGQPTNSGTSHTGATSERTVVCDIPGSLVTFSPSQSPSLRNADGSLAIFYYTTVDYRPHLTRLEDT